MTRAQSGILAKAMLRPRRAWAKAVLLPAAVFLGIVCGCAQSPQPAEQQPSRQLPASSVPQTFEDSTRFLKSIPPKPAAQLPYPTIATPPIEENPPLPLLTESERKKMEDDLTRLGEKHQKGMPKQPAAKQTAKKKKKKEEPAKSAVPTG